MTGPAPMVVSSAVEGPVDEAAIRRLIRRAGLIPGPVYGKNGKSYLRERIRGYNNAAHRSPWIVLVDLDRDADCAPPLRALWLPDPAPYMHFRVAVRAVEAWLMADAESLADFLSVPLSRVPPHPESLADPKRSIVDLARHSRRKAIREDLVPRPGSGRSTGAAYTSRLVEYTDALWHPEAASERSDSLRRCLDRLQELAEG